MTSIELEMNTIPYAPYINGALAAITATRRTLGVGTPTTGSYLSTITQLSGGKEEATKAATSSLAKLGLGHEAWAQDCIPRINAWISCHENSRWHANSAAHTTTEHAFAIAACRRQLDELITLLGSQKRMVRETYCTGTLLAAQTQDAALAAAAMDEHNKYVEKLTSRSAELATGVQHATKRLQEFLEKAQTCENGLPAVVPANSHICMPTKQLLDVSEALAAYAQSIVRSTCAPEFLAAVQNTHGKFSESNFIPPLSAFIEMYNKMLTEVSIRLDVQGRRLVLATAHYLLTDATAAESLAANGDT